VSWTFLSLEIVKALHEEQIALFGGSPGLRDAGLLESAIMRAEFKAQYESDASLGAVAGSLGYGLIKNHAFIDGNKRIGLASIATFLKLNGHVLPVPTEEQIAMVWRAAASEITEAEFIAWVERSTVAK
jgi:death-on-curing protein